MDTKIVSQLAVDEPLVQDADYRFDEHDRRYIDRQILGVEQHLVEALIRGRHATYVEVAPNSVPLQKGMAVCLASMQGSEPRVTFPSADALDNAVSAFGVVVYSGNPGAKALIAVGGVLPPSITGLAAGAKGYVRVNTSTGRLERVISLSPSDYGVGTVDNAGFMHVIPGITVGGGGGGSGEANFGENLPGGVGVYDGKLGVNLQFRPITGTGGITVNLNGDVIEVDGSSIGAVTGENIGDGADIFAGKVGNNLQLRGIKGTGGITATVNGDNIEIDGGALGASGEANDGANLPGGVGVYDGKDGVTLQFRPLAGTGGINVGLNGDVIEIDGSGIEGGGGPSVSGSGLATVTGGSFDPNALAWGSANTVLVSSGSGGTFVQITNAHVASNAAIAVTKLAPGSANTVLTSNGSSNSFAQITNVHVANNAGITVTKLAAGSANTVLTTNGSGTITWDAINLNSNMTTGTLPINKGGTGVTTLPGSSGNPLFNNAGALGAASNWTIGTGFMGGSGSFISLGGGTPASSGYVRVPYNGGASTLVVVGRASGGSDAAAVSWGPGDSWTFGSTSTDWNARGVVGVMSFSSTLTVNSQVSVALQRAGTTKFIMNSSGITLQEGSSTFIVGVNGEVYLAAGTAHVFSASVRGISLFSGSEQLGSGSTKAIYLPQGSASGNPTNGIYIWLEGEVLKAKFPSGQVKAFVLS